VVAKRALLLHDLVVDAAAAAPTRLAASPQTVRRSPSPNWINRGDQSPDGSRRTVLAVIGWRSSQTTARRSSRRTTVSRAAAAS
jgi:hypothetical protein